MTAFQLVRFLGLPGTAHTYLQMATYSPGVANPPADQWILLPSTGPSVVTGLTDITVSTRTYQSAPDLNTRPPEL